jgi:prepilin-type N-terminal cleavage/methylation domain-containing protein
VLTTAGGRGRGRAASSGGFTLTELMISVAVLLVAVLGTFATQLESADLMRTSRETNAAVMDLRSAMDRILASPFDDLAVAGSAYADGAEIEDFEELNLAGETITVDYPDYVAGGPVPDPLEIVLTIAWTDFAGRDRTLRLVSMRTQ